MREFAAALAIDPEHARSHAHLAFCASRRDDDAAALEASATALRLDPGDAFVHYARGWCLRAAGRSYDARRHAVEAVRLDPEDPDYRRHLAYVCSDLGEHELAATRADEAIALAPEDFAAHICRADVLRAAGRPAEARASADWALALAADSYWAHLGVARAAADQGDWRAAAGAAREALRLDPTSMDARQALAEALRARNPVYRGAVSFHEWFSRGSDRTRELLIIVSVFATCGLSIVFLLALLVVGWSSKDRGLAPLADVVLRFDRDGRHLLTPAGFVATDKLLSAFGGVLALAVALCCGASPGVAVSCAIGVAALPAVGCAANARPGWPRARVAAYVLGVLAVGACAVSVASVADWQSDRRNGKKLDDAAAGAIGLVALAFAGAWFAPDVARRQGYPWSHRFDLIPRPA